MDARDYVYYVSDMGRIRVYSKKTGRVRVGSGSVNRYTGYAQAYLQDKDGSWRTALVHRLVAKTYIDNPLGKEQVDHVNGDRADNRVANLRWATRRENNSTERARALKSRNARNSRHPGMVVVAMKGEETRLYSDVH